MHERALWKIANKKKEVMIMNEKKNISLYHRRTIHTENSQPSHNYISLNHPSIQIITVHLANTREKLTDIQRRLMKWFLIFNNNSNSISQNISYNTPYSWTLSIWSMKKWVEDAVKRKKYFDYNYCVSTDWCRPSYRIICHNRLLRSSKKHTSCTYKQQ